jgi:hypothetical protein
VLAACADTAGEEEEAAGDGPATVEAVEGSDIARVTLTDDAARRIDLQTDVVGSSSDGAIQIPYAAVLYDPDGHAWAFVKLDELTFEREPIEVDHVDGDVAVLSSGPAAGTEVATTGAPQLYGAELGVGEDE